MERALQEDPNVYKYDEIYEEMEQKKIDFRRDKKETDKKVNCFLTVACFGLLIFVHVLSIVLISRFLMCKRMETRCHSFNFIVTDVS